MSNYALRVPDSLFEYAKELAKKENCSLNQLIVTALAEKVSSIRTEAFFRERIARAQSSPYTLEDLLDMAPDGPPIPGDELPPNWTDSGAASVRQTRGPQKAGGAARQDSTVRAPTAVYKTKRAATKRRNTPAK